MRADDCLSISLKIIKDAQHDVSENLGISENDRALLKKAKIKQVEDWKKEMSKTCSQEIVDRVSQFANIVRIGKCNERVRGLLRAARLEDLDVITTVAETRCLNTLRSFVFLLNRIDNTNLRQLVNQHCEVYTDAIARDSAVCRNLDLVIGHQGLFEHAELDTLHNIIFFKQTAQLNRFIDILKWDEHENRIIREAIDRNYNDIVNSYTMHQNMRWIIVSFSDHKFIDSIKEDIDELIRGDLGTIAARYEDFIRRTSIEGWNDHNNPFVNELRNTHTARIAHIEELNKSARIFEQNEGRIAYIKELSEQNEANLAFIKALSERNKDSISDNADVYRNVRCIASYVANCPELLESIKSRADELIKLSCAECKKEMQIQLGTECIRPICTEERNNLNNLNELDKELYVSFIRFPGLTNQNNLNNPVLKKMRQNNAASISFVKEFSKRNQKRIGESADAYSNAILIIRYVINCPELLESITSRADALLHMSHAQCEKEMQAQYLAVTRDRRYPGQRSKNDPIHNALKSLRPNQDQSICRDAPLGVTQDWAKKARAQLRSYFGY